MQITIANNSSNPVPAPGAVTVQAGDTITLANRTMAEYEAAVEGYASDEVVVTATLETADLPPIQCSLKSPADPAADATTVAACGFDIEDLLGTAFSTTDKMYFGTFDDSACTIPSNATLDTAVTGTIVSGAGTNVVEVTPAAGVLSLTATIPSAAARTVYFKAWPHASNARLMDASGVDAVAFTTT